MEKVMTGGPNGPMHEKIGEIAGRVWRQLRAHGPSNPAMLARAVGMAEVDVHQAIGWLAREGKIRTDGHDRLSLVEREMSIAI